MKITVKYKCVLLSMLFVFLFSIKTITAVELMIDVDVYDNLSEPQYYKTDIYRPENIAEFFENCKQNGVSVVYWRAQCQIASFWSKLNYNLSEELAIRSFPDARHRSGAFAAKIGSGKENGIFQNINTISGKIYTAKAWISAPKGNAAYLCIKDVNTGDIIAKGSVIQDTGDGFHLTGLNFESPGMVSVGVYGMDNDDINIFVVDDIELYTENDTNIILNGDMEQYDSLLPTNWRTTERANFLVLCGDVLEMDNLPGAWKIMRAGWWQRVRANRKAALDIYDPLAVAVHQAKKNGIKLFAWIDPLDDGRRVPPMCAGGWVSRFHEDNPQYRLVDKDGNRRWGQLCFGYKEVRDYKNALIKELLDYGVDGIYIKTGFQHNLVWDNISRRYDHYAHNDIALEEYHKRWERPQNNDYELKRLKQIQGEYFYQWISEASEIIRANGKELVYSIAPGNYLQDMLGGWPNQWEKLVENKIIDLLLIEPRINSSNEGFLENLDNNYGYVKVCKKNGVKIGYDFYLNAVAEKRIRPLEMASKPFDFFADELQLLAKEHIDLIGIYEGMYVDRDNYWSHIKKVYDYISQLPKESKKVYNRRVDDVYGKNVALSENGTIAYVEKDGQKIDADNVIDGIVLDSSILIVSDGGIFDLYLEFPEEKNISVIQIFPGNTSCIGNPSGECGIASYSLKAKKDEKWIDIIEPVTKSPTSLEMTKTDVYNFFYNHEFKNPIRTREICLSVEKSSDTGKRNGCSEPCVPVEKHVTHLREIKIFAK